MAKFLKPPHFTNYGYLSISKQDLAAMIEMTKTTENSDIIEVDGIKFSISKLSKNITYSDNRDFFRWDKSDINRCKFIRV